jgi:IS5 family transposase
MQRMSLCHEGLESKLTDTVVRVVVSVREPLLALANTLDWSRIAQLALEDLKGTSKGCWSRGRKVSLRSHLAVMILQALLKETDRGLQQRIGLSPLLQVFCGQSVLPTWRCPDHTKIERFRNRLSAQTHRAIGEYVLQVAQQHGFADASWMDVDSTVQEANISYPADSTLMKKLCEKAHKVLQYLQQKQAGDIAPGLQIDIKEIRKKAQSYFFLPKTVAIEKRREVFASYHRLVKQQLRPVIQCYRGLRKGCIEKLPWHVRRALEQVRDLGWRYLLDVGHFVRTHTLKPGKRLAFHVEAVACIKKGKVGKPHEFGRVFQLGRIGGNFLLAMPCTDVRMQDKHSLLPAIHEHRRLFGEDGLQQVGSDKGYYSARNIKAIQALGINADGIQRPVTVKQRPAAQVTDDLRRRRAGIEPLIQHAKSFGLGKSRMKSDKTVLASGYRAVMGFNLHQLMRHLQSPSHSANLPNLPKNTQFNFATATS